MSATRAALLRFRAGGATRPAPSRCATSARHWEEHVDAGERVGALLEKMADEIAATPGAAGLVRFVRQLEDEIAAADVAAWRAIKALESEGLTRAPNGC